MTELRLPVYSNDKSKTETFNEYKIPVNYLLTSVNDFINYLATRIKGEDDKLDFCNEVIDNIEHYVTNYNNWLELDTNRSLFFYKEPYFKIRTIKNYLKTTSIEYQNEWRPKVEEFINQYKQMTEFNHNFIKNNKDEIILIIQNAIETKNFKFNNTEKQIKSTRTKLTPEQKKENRKISDHKQYLKKMLKDNII